MTSAGGRDNFTGGRVGVIGAGIAGLVTAKVLRDDGFEVVVFDKEDAPGGVWIEARTYPGLRTNNSRDTYAYTDHPYPESADVFPTAGQVREYLASYVDRFGLAPMLRLSTEVIRVSEVTDGFELKVCGPDGVEDLRFDFVVVCAGVFSTPQVPDIEGGNEFGGVLLHSSQAIDPGLVAGRRVIVVGAGKSALDCAAWAGEHARETTLVFRKAHPMLPRFLPGGTPSDRTILNRFAESFFRYHRQSRIERFLHGPGKKLTERYWRVVSAVMRLLLRSPKIMTPDAPLPAGIENLGVGDEFFRMARRGRIALRRDSIAAFPGGRTVELVGGQRLEADVVVFATGWRQELEFLAPDLEKTVRVEGRFRLYRHILPPTLPRLGFIGYGSSDACQLSAEVSAHWLSQHFLGELDLPTADDMHGEITRVGQWLSEVMPARPEGYYLGPYLAHHIDDLMRDMGLPVRRTDNFISEYFDTFLPGRYADLTEERLQARVRGARRRRYVSAGGSLGGVAAITLAYALYRRLRAST
ncbi:flavin-containing monooxygenase [Nocardia sp. CDC160]|uniref:flavin-containing monooxygenase n=1 Tax=Nocardia sp. CDC160 TaxID=3112166 RepID=UPI002DB6EF93|nr:NAD(P)/FAD-dependent oxidoreductase [Nocardia sp. CDC160]MEC3915273.1 NAD(P)/FAD-dependent oxidoreductase [Nocardia sp. CDC160]